MAVDDELTVDEWMDVLERKRRATLLKQVFLKMDADCSGAVDLNEFAQLAEGTDDAALVASLFTDYDVDGDGRITYPILGSPQAIPVFHDVSC